MNAVVIAPYTPRWPAEFERTAAELRSAVGAAATAVEHIGSTSVPGLCAKPIVDILLGVPALAAAEQAIPRLAAIGFRYVPEHEAEIPDRRYFVRAPAARLRVNLHAVVDGGDLWLRHVAFRDELRADADLRRAYAGLKQDLAARFAHDRPAYTEAKGPFVRQVLARLPGAA